MKNICLTIDLEPDWGEANGSEQAIIESLPYLLNLLEELKIKATFFCVGKSAAKLPTQIKSLFKEGHEIGSHGFNHIRLEQLSLKRLKQELIDSKKCLEDIISQPIQGFRAPYLAIPKGADECIADAKYEYHCNGGKVIPSLTNFHLPSDNIRFISQGNLKFIPISRTRERLNPFSLTLFRICWPLMKFLLPKNPRVFFFHLHEISIQLPRAKNKISLLQGLNCGKKSREILEKILNYYQSLGKNWKTCKAYLKEEIQDE